MTIFALSTLAAHPVAAAEPPPATPGVPPRAVQPRRDRCDFDFGRIYARAHRNVPTIPAYANPTVVPEKVLDPSRLAKYIKVYQLADPKNAQALKDLPEGVYVYSIDRYGRFSILNQAIPLENGHVPAPPPNKETGYYYSRLKAEAQARAAASHPRQALPALVAKDFKAALEEMPSTEVAPLNHPISPEREAAQAAPNPPHFVPTEETYVGAHASLDAYRRWSDLAAGRGAQEPGYVALGEIRREPCATGICTRVFSNGSGGWRGGTANLRHSEQQARRLGLPFDEHTELRDFSVNQYPDPHGGAAVAAWLELAYRSDPELMKLVAETRDLMNHIDRLGVGIAELRKVRRATYAERGTRPDAAKDSILSRALIFRSNWETAGDTHFFIIDGQIEAAGGIAGYRAYLRNLRYFFDHLELPEHLFTAEHPAR